MGGLEGGSVIPGVISHCAGGGLYAHLKTHRGTCIVFYIL